MFLRRRPTQGELEAFARRSAEMSLSYAPVGIAQHPPPRFQMDSKQVVLGRGEAAFSKAKNALLEWRHFDLGWLVVFPSRPNLAMGTDLLVLVRHLGFWSLNGCRIVYLVADKGGTRQFGYAYGTLTDHAETGEEIFKVSMCGDTEEVRYEIRAVSRPRAALARLGFPVTRMMQARFRRDSAASMRQAVG